MRVVYKPAIAGFTGALATMFWYPAGASVTTLVGPMNLFLVMGAATAAFSLITDTLHEYIFPETNLSEKYVDQVSSTIGLGLSATSTIAASYLLQPELFRSIGAVKLASIGIAAEIASSYVYNNYLDA